MKDKDLGVNGTGDVLTGRKTLREVLDIDAQKTFKYALPHYTHPAQYDPVLRAHLHAAPPKPDSVCPFSGDVQVAGQWMSRQEYEARYPDLSKE